MKHVRVILLCAVIALMAAACGGAPAGNATAPAAGDSTPAGESNAASSAGGPADAVRGYMLAALTGEGEVGDFICSTIADDLRNQIISGMSTVADSYEQMGATLDLSGLTYTVENETADSADVVLGGQITFTVGGVSQTAPMTTTYRAVNENGWKICG
jgi:hypothetical protein